MAWVVALLVLSLRQIVKEEDGMVQGLRPFRGRPRPSSQPHTANRWPTSKGSWGQIDGRGSVQ